MFGKEMLKITGKLTIEKFDLNGILLETIEIPNMIVDAGKNHILLRLLSGTTETPMSHMGVGIGDSRVLANDTALTTPIGTRVNLLTPTVNGNTISYVGTFLAGNATGSISEAGIFNALTGGKMLCKTVFPTITKIASQSIIISWVITLS